MPFVRWRGICESANCEVAGSNVGAFCDFLWWVSGQQVKLEALRGAENSTASGWERYNPSHVHTRSISLASRTSTSAQCPRFSRTVRKRHGGCIQQMHMADHVYSCNQSFWGASGKGCGRSRGRRISPKLSLCHSKKRSRPSKPWQRLAQPRLLSHLLRSAIHICSWPVFIP